MQRQFNNLEIHVSHACNLTCESCLHYSDQHHKGNIPLEVADHWMKQWNKRLRPAHFSMLGGEPAIHPQFPDFIKLARKNWPTSRLRIVTNGFYLHRHPSLPAVLKEVGNAVMTISIHHDSPVYLLKINDNMRLVREWIKRYDIDVKFTKSFGRWYRSYLGNGHDMKPFNDGDPRKSWEICDSRLCKQLFDGKIWKCPPLAYLDMQNKKYHLSPEWANYLSYQPLTPNCSDEELNEFFDKQEEPYCGMCPAFEREFSKKIPLPVKTDEFSTEDVLALDGFLVFATWHPKSGDLAEVKRFANRGDFHPVIRVAENTYRIDFS